MRPESIKVCVDLRDQIGSVRDQGPRPTCMAFASSDCHAFARGIATELSTEYAFYHAVSRAKHDDRTRGVTFDAMKSAIELDGQPVETDWPYIRGLVADDEWKVPDGIGSLFYKESIRLAPTLSEVRLSIESGTPVWTMMKISESFIRLDDSVLSAVTEPDRGNHAVLIVGCGEIAGEHCYLVRNSWGKGWAADGYGWLHTDYLDPRLILAAHMN